MMDLNAFDGLTTVYHEAGEREIRAVVGYINASKLYTDKAHKNEMPYDLAVELCEKGFLRVYDTDTFYSLVSFKDTGSTITIGYGSKTVTVSAPSL